MYTYSFAHAKLQPRKIVTRWTLPTRELGMEVDADHVLALARAWNVNRSISELDYMIEVIRLAYGQNEHEYAKDLCSTLLEHGINLFPLQQAALEVYRGSVSVHLEDEDPEDHYEEA